MLFVQHITIATQLDWSEQQSIADAGTPTAQHVRENIDYIPNVQNNGTNMSGIECFRKLFVIRQSKNQACNPVCVGGRDCGGRGCGRGLTSNSKAGHRPKPWLDILEALYFRGPVT